MKILIVEENINSVGGVERVVSTLANELINIYEKVDILSIEQSSQNPFFKYDEKINFMYLYNSQKRKSSKMKKNNILYYFYRVIERFSENYIINEKIKKSSNVFDNYDVIIFGRVKVATKFLQNIKIDKKIIVRDAIHLIDHSRKTKKLMKKFFVTSVDKFIVSSDESIKQYKDFFKNKLDKMEKIYNPLGIQPIVNYKYENKLICANGRFCKQKGFENLIKAFAIVNKKFPDWKLKIIGSGKYQKEYKKLINKLKLNNTVIIEKSTSDIVSKLNEASMYVMTSRFEGYANSLVEALACGVPSISYNWLMGANEIIKDNQNGIIVKLKNPLKYYKNKDCKEDVINLAQSIIDLIENPEKMQKFSLEAVKISESRNKNKIINKWLKVISDLNEMECKKNEIKKDN